MDVRTRITLDDLIKAYAPMGLFPQGGTPFVFVRESDDLVMFHQPISQGFSIEFDWRIVALDIRRTENLLGMSGLVDEFLASLAQLLFDLDAPDQTNDH